MAVAEHYNSGRHVLTELGLGLDPAQAATPVPACPGWTVKDVYAHLAGVAADVLAGNLEGVATPPWTARHVADRADQSLTQILAEWATGSISLAADTTATGAGVELLVPEGWASREVQARLVVAGSEADLAHRHDMVTRGAEQGGIGREAVLGLRHADLKMAVALFLPLMELVAHP